MHPDRSNLVWWKIFRMPPIMDIPFSKPKGSLSSNRKRGAHLYGDTVPSSDLPKHPETPVELAPGTIVKWYR